MISPDEDDENADWLRANAGEWPFPEFENAVLFREYIISLGFTVEGFMETETYKRWVGEIPWLKNINDYGDPEVPGVEFDG